MNPYGPNRAALEERFPGIGQDLDRGGREENPETQFTRDGLITLRWKGVWLHSRHFPRKEAQRLLQIQGNPLVLFYAFGLGYQVEELLHQRPDLPLAVIIGDVRLFNTALGLRDLRALFSSPQLSLALAPEAEALGTLLGANPGREVQVVMLRSAVDPQREYFDQIDREVRSFLTKRKVNQHTHKRFGRLWISNICRNLPFLESAPGVKELQETFRTLPALLLAAGPTLSEVIPLLGELKKRMLIVGVDTTLRACREGAVSPDFLVLTDPQYWNSRHLDYCNSPDTILLSDLSSHPRAFRERWAQIVLCSTAFPLGEYFEGCTETKGRLKSGGSVATAAWDFLRYTGVSTIYCSGLDLAFPGGETHYRGSTFEEWAHRTSGRTAPAELASWKALRDGNPFFVQDSRGERVLTDQRLALYISWFKEQVAQSPQVRSLRLSPTGAHIEGMEISSPRELLALPPRREEIDALREGLLKIRPQIPKGVLSQAHTQLLGELRVLQTLAREGRTQSRLLLTQGATQEGLDKLTQVDQRILSRESREIAGFILGPLLEEYADTTGEENPLEKSCRLYGEIERGVTLHLSMLQRTVLTS